MGMPSEIMIGLLHPGEMGAAVGRCLTGLGYTVLWASDGRGPQTAARAREAGPSEAARELARAIAADEFEPDLILSIARGGLFVAGALGYALSVKNLHVMNVEFYNGVGATLDMPVMLPPVPSAVDFSEKKVLVADDVADSGKTLELVRGFIEGHVAEVRCAVVYEKPTSLVKCDYVWKQTDRWINFPWSSLPPVLPGVLDA